VTEDDERALALFQDLLAQAVGLDQVLFHAGSRPLALSRSGEGTLKPPRPSP
jgi:hypothetical protein